MNRVVVTGAGVVCAAGFSVPAFWDALLAARPRFAEAKAVPGTGILAAEILDDAVIADLGVKASSCDRSALFAVAAARQALAEAGFDAFARPERVAVVIGNGAGGVVSIEEQYDRIHQNAQARVHPMTVARAMVSSSASWVSMATGARGPCFVTSSACASAAHAIGAAFQLLRSGAADVAIAGGTEAPLSNGVLRAWDAMKIMSSTTCRPFARTRDGLILAEGAGLIVLETAEHATRRGRAADVELAGFGSNADAGNLFTPDPEGMAAAMRLALADAGLSPGDVAYVNAHGTGTAANDKLETEAMKAVFGPGACPPISSIKGVTGHSLGAAGALEAIATVLAIRNGVAPPTANYDEPDPDCDLDYVPNVPRTMAIRTAMSNSFAFGGLNASLVFAKAR
ncbi:beta-ketoacyl-[acyl-carrier-protein] synthase family protein [Chelatococcus sambhunathii]|uniref:Beta-ketoacyl-[acyl-carrier-protein] synthase family protein n=1 Tax=Chelatococcus sambhunathii TaxID=363953 RepID=A0ABU1DE57_9HYPH|nr:beta-ketoacyl-[acyl-carrier-protein] synthase family protein [Chelatococcus sambhunathii]MDR4306393.1 beta-ketoacyl-[acyl-carrier-protein] synthase family protein [Chelatococcus sambhunathii]